MLMSVRERSALFEPMSRHQLFDLQRAKGVAIFLVVLGHVKVDAFPAGNNWFVWLWNVVYSFHMSFFMFITGLIMFYTYPRMQSFVDYVHFIKKKSRRLVPAYFLFAAVIGIAKMVAGKFGQVPIPVQHFLDLDILVRPSQTYCGTLWYIYVLFLYFLIVPVLLRLFKERFESLLIFSFLVYFVPRTPYFAQGKVCEYLFVFVLGGYAAQHFHEYKTVLDRYSNFFLFSFCAAILSMLRWEIPKIIMGLLSIPALHSLVRRRFFEKSAILKMLGEYTFPIYLMHTLAIGFSRMVIQKYWSWDGTNFYFVAPILVFSGLFLPIAVQRFFISRIPVLRRIVY